METKMKRIFWGLTIILVLVLASCTTKETVQPIVQDGVVVNLDNFIHADSTRAYNKQIAKSSGKVNVIIHERDFITPDTQDVIRSNRDTLYSRVILNVKDGATISLGNYDGYQTANVLDINHSQIAVQKGEGTLKLDSSMLTEGDFVYIIIRTGVNRDSDGNPTLDEARKAQDEIKVKFSSNEMFNGTDYDFSTLDAVKYQIFERFAEDPSKYLVRDGFGKVGERVEAAAQTMIAIGWGGLSGTEAVYSPFTATGERRTFSIDKPNLKFEDGGFFSFTIYNENGWIATDNYAINSLDMIANADGTYTITFLASGEPELDGDLNVVRTPRGKLWTGVLRAYEPVEKVETFDWADNWTAIMTKELQQ